MKFLDRITQRLNFPSELKWHEWFLLAFLIGGGATYITYKFGVGNHIEQLPIVMRFRDSDYLLNDFFVNASSGPGPRYFYALILGTLSKIFPLENLFFSLTILANTAVALITMKTSRKIFKQNVFTSILSTVLVFTIKPFNLGEENYIYHSLIPAVLALPFTLIAVMKGLQGKAVWAAVFAGIASIFHPLLGFETGGIVLLVLIIDWLRNNEWVDIFKFDKIKKLLFSSLVMLGFALFTVFPMMGTNEISSEKFIELLAFFRHPHHYMPSSFKPLDYLAGFSFISVVYLITWKWKKGAEENKRIGNKILTLMAVIIVMCLVGYVFVELIPVRLITTLQTFRMLYILKWLGAILISGVFTGLMRKNDVILGKPIAIGPVLLICIMLWMIAAFSVDFISVVAFILWALVAILYLLICEGKRVIVGLALVVAIGLTGHPADPLKIQVLLGDKILIGTQISLDELNSPTIEIARFAAENLPQGALVLTPPDMGIFRIIGERAIIVDFDSFPFGDSAMLEWESRLITSYGETDEVGFRAAQELKENYRLLNDMELEDLSEIYGFGYAVIYSERVTGFPVLFDNKYFKLIEIDI